MFADFSQSLFVLLSVSADHVLTLPGVVEVFVFVKYALCLSFGFDVADQLLGKASNQLVIGRIVPSGGQKRNH